MAKLSDCSDSFSRRTAADFACSIRWLIPAQCKLKLHCRSPCKQCTVFVKPRRKPRLRLVR
jgi:hypothetical protein